MVEVVRVMVEEETCKRMEVVVMMRVVLDSYRYM
jgi:hypothetical protein